MNDGNKEIPQRKMTWTTDWPPWPCVITSCLKILRVADGVRVSGDGLRIGHEQPQQRRETVHGFVQSVLKMQRRPHLLVVLDDCQQPAMNTVHVYMSNVHVRSVSISCQAFLRCITKPYVQIRQISDKPLTSFTSNKNQRTSHEICTSKAPAHCYTYHVITAWSARTLASSHSCLTVSRSTSTMGSCLAS